MDTKTFYRHVSSWIASYRDPQALQWVRRFIENSRQPAEVKAELRLKVDKKEEELNGIPQLVTYGADTFIADNLGQPRLYSSQYPAICAVVGLKLKGYDAHVVPGTFHRIKVTATPAQTA